MAAVDRAWFLPDRIWPFDPLAGTSTNACTRTSDPEPWLHHADSNTTLVTQWDDGAHTGGDAGIVATSSSLQPSLVMAMLNALDVEPGMRVLQIGTGTGWTAGLLAHRLGNENVVTIDVDEDVADGARARLYEAGLHPTVLCRDELAGDPPGAPYDRILATCALRTLPAAWIEQVRPGGIILAPWGTSFTARDALVKLTVAEDGKSASGDFLHSTGGVGGVEFVTVRGQRTEPPRHEDYARDSRPSTVHRATTSLGPQDLTGPGPYGSNAFVVGLCVPEAAHTVHCRDDGSVDAAFYSLCDRSWASVSWDAEGGPGLVRQNGQRELWTMVEHALYWWIDQDRPPVDCFGLTVDATDGEHRAWVDRPDHAVPLMV